MRAFIGLPLPGDAKAALSRVQSGLSVGRAVAAENLHLTLAFLDDQPEAALAELDTELARITGPVAELRITGLDVPGGGKARLMFAVVAQDLSLVVLRNQVRAAVRAVGISLPRERFRPHVTLARFRPRKAPGEMERLHGFMAASGGFSLPGFSVSEFLLYRSTLTPDGPRYEALARYPLG